MKIKKVYNNNVALAEDYTNFEMVVMGKGLGFQKKAGDDIDKDKIEKTFVTTSETFVNNLSELLEEMPYEIMELSKQIIDMAEKELATELNDTLFLTLTDHLQFAIDRVNRGFPIGNALMWEVKKFYQAEYRTSIKALELVENKTSVTLPEEEAASIALHLFNARQDSAAMNETLAMTTIVNDVVTIIKYHFGMSFNEESMNYSRFITHIKYFAYRTLRGEYNDDNLDALYDQISKRYPDAYACAMKVQEYLIKQHHMTMTYDELAYFMIHIHRVTSREKNK